MMGDLKNVFWRRAGGRCECSAACDHHLARRCGVMLEPELWTIQPIDLDAAFSLGNAEAVCMECRGVVRRWDIEHERSARALVLKMRHSAVA